LAKGNSRGKYNRVYKEVQSPNFIPFPSWWKHRWSPKLWAFIHNWHGFLP
jgi:hypothetical protein